MKEIAEQAGVTFPRPKLLTKDLEQSDMGIMLNRKSRDPSQTREVDAAQEREANKNFRNFDERNVQTDEIGEGMDLLKQGKEKKKQGDEGRETKRKAKDY